MAMPLTRMPWRDSESTEYVRHVEERLYSDSGPNLDRGFHTSAMQLAEVYAVRKLSVLILTSFANCGNGLLSPFYK